MGKILGHAAGFRKIWDSGQKKSRGCARLLKFNREASNGYGGSHPKTRANRITHLNPRCQVLIKG
ncbi:hypothetical protein NBRC116588_06730 [Pyruvatibacter sp. HU-CL02332]